MKLSLLRILALSAGLMLGGGAALAQKSFVRDDLASDGIRLEDTLKRENGRPTATAAQLRRDGDGHLLRGDNRRALASFAAAVAVDPASPSGWLSYARAANRIETNSYSERYQLQSRATIAAYQAYQRATTRPEEAAALTLLADTFATREIWRPSLNAYRASLAIVDDPGTRKTYEELREKHGFRLMDYKTDSDAVSPRACFQFSEPLAGGKVDFAPFVTVSGGTGTAVTTEDQQLCVDGLKHGERYRITLRQGIPSSVDETLLKTAVYEIYVRDRSPSVRFTGRNYVLPRTGQEGVPVISVNTPEVQIDVFRIGDRNLLPTLRSDELFGQLDRSSASAIAKEKGFKIWSGRLTTANDLNKDVVTAFPALKATGPLEPGIYVMTARPPGGPELKDDDENSYEENRRSTQWFVVSDLGIATMKGADGIHVTLRSLAGGQPVPGAQVRLVARNNEVLATKTTDALGQASFDPGLARGEGGLAPGLVVATTAGPSGDYNFLDMGQSPFDLSDRGVKGRSVATGLDAFLYTERGVYRSGETVNLTTLLRDRKGATVPSLPLTLVFKRPDGVEHRREQVADQGLGGRATSLALLNGTMRGTWRVQAFLDPKAAAIGEASFLVEDYVPERLELTLAPKTPTLAAGEPAQIDLTARWLYGAPGSGLDVTGEVVVQAASKPGVKGLEDYEVGLADEEFNASTVSLEDPTATGPDGKVIVQAPVQSVVAPRPVEAKVVLRVGEPGGRAIERSVTLPILPEGPVLGVKKTFGPGGLAGGGNATFDVVLASPDGSRLARQGVTWTLSRVQRTYQWYNSDGRWGYEPVKSTRRLADGRIDVTTAAPARITAPVELGAYRLDVVAEGIATARTSINFYVGYYGEPTADTPDLLEVTLDKSSYRSGEEMRANVKPRFAGRATLQVVTDGLLETRDVEVPAEGTTVSIPVKAEWGAGAYLVATAYRPLDGAARRMPGRALGLAWFEIDRAARDLQVSLGTVEKMRPRQPMKVPVRLAGLTPGEEAYVTVAAVDLGILNLTRYVTPNPAAHFFGQKQLGVELRDLYGYLIDGMQGAAGAIRSGGDAMPGELGGIPPSQEPLARYSGVVKVGPDGTAEIAFDIPAFNGTVRVSAVGWTKGRVGSAEKDVIVRDPVVITGTLPRFLLVGDRSRLRLDLDNVEGAAADYQVEVDLAGPILGEADSLRSTVKLASGQKGAVTIPIAAAGPGDSAVTVRLTGPDVAIDQRYALRIQPGTSSLVRRTVRPLVAGGGVEIGGDLLADILPGTGAVSVSVSPLAALDVPGLLQALDRYPYGCSEQVVSRALPLLYANRLAAAADLGLDGAVDERVRGAIERVLTRQDSNGGFGLWSPSSGEDHWLDAYVSDFLTRARELKFAVPPVAFNLALERLRNFVANTTEAEGKGDELAYAAYVLARNGRPVAGDLRYLADTKLSSFKTPMSRAQLAAALGLIGDRGRAGIVYASAVNLLRGIRDGVAGRVDYGTRLRDAAGLIALASETGVSRDTLQPVTDVIEQERGTRTYTSTQEQAWMVLAAEALQSEMAAARITVAGTPVQSAARLVRTWRAPALAGGPIRIANEGSVSAQLIVNVTGNPIGPEPAESRGYAIERTYYKLDGKKTDPAQVRQNERLVTVLKVTEPQSLRARILLVDRLPAGFEIDNPKLVDSASVGALDWLKNDVTPENAEYRDDRFVAAFDRYPRQPATFTVAYTIRAVAPGRYVHPPAMVEDMYRPDRFGRTAFGTVEVTAAR